MVTQSRPLTTLSLTLLIFFLATAVPAATLKEPNADVGESGKSCSCDLSALRNPYGWDIPGLDGSRSNGKPAALRGANIPTGVFVSILKPGTKKVGFVQARCTVGEPFE